MQKITYDAQYFNPRDVLECGQVFRFERFKEGYKVFSTDKACYLYSDGVTTTVECENADYFYRYFDLANDYGAIIEKIRHFNVPVLDRSLEVAKGLRLLNQNAEEMIFSFIISQNNNIPRIKKIILRICEGLGEEREFMGEKYHAFPSAAAIAATDVSYFKALGAGYRDEFLVATAKKLVAYGLENLQNADGEALKKQLLTFHGIGPKVADCIALFAFKKTECFPVDTWIEKLYREDFGGSLTDRKKINAYFCSLFGEYSGYVQQYLFYAKRAHL